MCILPARAGLGWPVFSAPALRRRPEDQRRAEADAACEEEDARAAGRPSTCVVDGDRAAAADADGQLKHKQQAAHSSRSGQDPST